MGHVDPSNLRMQFSDSARVEDLCAFLESYLVEIVGEDGAVHLRMPAYTVSVESLVGDSEHVHPVFVNLLQYEPPPGEREPKTRWPFWVDHPMSVLFRLDGNVWKFHFRPVPVRYAELYTRLPC